MLPRKMFRDMKLHSTQFISIFLMAILGVLVYAGINSEWYGMQKEADRYYSATNLADMWIIGNNFTAENENSAKEVSGVSMVQRRLVLDGVADLEGDPVLRINIVDGNAVSRPYTVGGSSFDAETDGLWLDKDFARAHDLGVGDKITVRAAGAQISKTIEGLILHPEYVHNVKDDSEMMPDAEEFGFAYLPRRAVSDAGTLPYNQLLIKTGAGSDPLAVRSHLEEALAGSYGMVITRENHPSVEMFRMEIAQNKALGGVFPIVFFLIAALTMLTTMTRMTSGQRTQIGILKALGFSRRKILFHYVSYGVWLGLIGGLIGLVAGPLIVPPVLFAMQKTIYTLPDWYAAISYSDVLAVVLAVLCCSASSYFACRRELNDVPAATLRPRAPKTSRHTRLEKSRFWLRLGFSVQWNLRDIIRNKVRSIMAVIGVAGCMALLLWGLGLRDTIGSVTGLLYGDINTYESKINLEEDIPRENLDSLLKAYPGQLIQESAIELTYGGVSKSGLLTVAASGKEYNPEDRDGNPLRLPDDGIALSYKMAKLLGAETGAELQWRIYGEKAWQKSTVRSIYRIPLGQGIVMSKTAYERMGNTMKPTSLLAADPAGGAGGHPGVRGVQDKAQLISSFNSILDSMQMIIAILILAAVILGAVVLYNLGALSFTERARELATLKVLGFSKKRIQSLLQKQNIWLTILGIVIGLPAGYVLIEFMLQTMSESSDFAAWVSWATVAICVAATFLLSTAVNFLMSRRVSGIDMVSSLKSVE
jgi:putative ABC transport system permease protein